MNAQPKQPFEGFARVVAMLVTSLEECRDHLSLGSSIEREVARDADKALRLFEEWRART